MIGAALDLVEFSVPAVPPSLNVVASKGSHWKWTKLKKEWHEVLTPALRATDLEPCGRIYATGELTFPDRRKRDQGNFRTFIEKVLGDVLQAGDWLPDDSWDHYEFGDLGYRYEKGVARTRLVLMPS